DDAVITNTYYDSVLAGLDVCIEGGESHENIDCIGVEAAGYFKGNNENEPLDVWDWELVWEIVEDDYPDFVEYPTAAPAWEGEGDEDFPYLVTTCEQLQALDEAPSAYFELTSHIDCR